MKFHNYKSATHPLHDEIKPIVSALKFGRKKIAEARFKKLCDKRALMRWEALVVSDMIRKSFNDQIEGLAG